MDVPTSEFGYTIATTRRENHEVRMNRWVALEKKKIPLFHATRKQQPATCYHEMDAVILRSAILSLQHQFQYNILIYAHVCKWYHSFRFPHQNPVCTSLLLPYTCHTPPSLPPSFSPSHNIL